MPVLAVREYGDSYFDGYLSKHRHPAGFCTYTKELANPYSGRQLVDIANELNQHHNLAGKKVLELGCAKGFIVERLRAICVQAFGIDVSGYAIANAPFLVRPYVSQANVFTEVNNYGNKEFDLVFSVRFFECVPETELPMLLAQLNKIACKQVHYISERANASYYNNRRLHWWLKQRWNKGTELVSMETGERLIK